MNNSDIRGTVFLCLILLFVLEAYAFLMRSDISQVVLGIFGGLLVGGLLLPSMAGRNKS